MTDFDELLAKIQNQLDRMKSSFKAPKTNETPPDAVRDPERESIASERVPEDARNHSTTR